MSVNFFMVMPQPKEVRFSRKYREWTARDDAVQVAAVGRTKKEAISKWQAAWWAAVFPVTTWSLPR